MPLTQNRTNADYTLAESAAAGATAQLVATVSGYLVAAFAWTASASTVVLQQNGTTIATLTSGAPGVETDFPLVGTSAVPVTAGDFFSFTNAAASAVGLLIRAYD